MPETSCDLSTCFLCNWCMPEWKEAIATRKRTIQLKKGRRVFHEGDKVRGIFFVYSGSAKVYKRWSAGKELIVRFAKTGDILGHRGFGGDDAYPVSASTLEDTRLCFIDHEFLEASLRTNPELTYRLMQFYASELQKAEKRMRDLAHMEVKGRIADALLQIAKVYGYNKDKYIAASVTRKDIASYAGTTYETIFKFFTNWTRKKIIATAGKSIRINKPEQLRKFIVGGL